MSGQPPLSDFLDGPASVRSDGRPFYYVLDKETHEVVPALTNREAFAPIEGWNGEDRHVGSTHVGPYWVSTVFLVIDHSFGFEGPPVLFETMVFDETPENAHENAFYPDRKFAPEVEGLEKRYCTWAEANAGHSHVVAVIQAMLAAQGIEAEVAEV